MKEYCWERFDSEMELIIHIKNAHRGEGLFACPSQACQQLFIERTEARQHVKDFHEEIYKPNLRILPAREPMEASEIVDLTEKEPRKCNEVDLFEELMKNTQIYYESIRFLLTSNLSPKKKLKLSSGLKLKLLKKERVKTSEVFMLMQILINALRKKLRREKPKKKDVSLEFLEQSECSQSSITDEEEIEEWHLAL